MKKKHSVLGEKHNEHESSNLPLQHQSQRRQFFIINGRVIWIRSSRCESPARGELKA